MLQTPISDTSNEIKAELLARLRELSYETRLHQLNDLLVLSRNLILAGIKAQNPNLTEIEILKLFAIRSLGEKCAKQLPLFNSL